MSLHLSTTSLARVLMSVVEFRLRRRILKKERITILVIINIFIIDKKKLITLQKFTI